MPWGCPSRCESFVSNFYVSAGQGLSVVAALIAARCDFLLHLDDDELLFPEAASSRSGRMAMMMLAVVLLLLLLLLLLPCKPMMTCVAHQYSCDAWIARESSGLAYASGSCLQH